MIDVSMLNENQKEAVLAEDIYLRIIAGAGSGKTRVLTMRIARLIDEGANPRKILAITFTNKAANEMKERIRKMLDEEGGIPWISTIHSLCVRILREDIEVMGWPRNFTVMDADDQRTILKEAYKQLDLDTQAYPHAAMLNYISNNKSADISVDLAYKLAGTYSADKTKAQVYEYYVERQKALFALDFDDLILWVVKMFKMYSEVLDKWQRRFDYIHVDEFQDIDKIQYQLIKQLTGIDNSLCVVGDPDQTIYTWRGADVNIIMQFNKDFPNTHTVILNENYRSTDCILNAANDVIRNNKNRMEKDLFTNRKSEEKITHYSAVSDAYEAAWMASEIQRLHKKGKPYHDIAILYRSNYLSRSLEKGMRDERIPYVIYGGLRFYERQEVKDALCYLRMAVMADDLALTRIINRPKRGIGAKTMDRLSEVARSTGRSMFQVLESERLFSGKAQKTLDDFVEMVHRWQDNLADHRMENFKLFEKIVEESGYRSMLEADNEIERLENLKELIDDVREFDENNPELTIEEYLQEVNLLGDRDETMAGDYIQMMTVHAAKGLEFDTVFISDLNDGIFPNERAMNEGNRGVEEERRLAYVAFTRARNKLYLCEAGGFSYILQKARTKSRFINEIEEDYIEHIGSASRGNPFDVKPMSELVFKSEEKTYEEAIAKAESTHMEKGEQVMHTKFGKGVILKYDNGMVEIAFPYPYGVKKLLAGHPSLKRLKDLN